MPRPSYPLFDHLTRLDLRRGAALRPRLSRRLVDRLRQRRARAHAAHARACSSSARTTRPARSSRADELDRLAAICAPRGIAIIADEVFADYELEPGARAAAGPRCSTRRDVLSFALGGLSKSVGLPQVKLGWIAVGGPDRPGRRGARAARADLRHLSVGVDAGAARGRASCSSAAPPSARRSPRASRRTTAALQSLAVGGAVVPRAAAATAAGTRCCRCRRSSRKRTSSLRPADG